jgi:DNA-directed RNA polymerase specialized sigma24 family protein
MEDALAKLTPEQRQMIMAKAQQEANQQVMQEMMELMNKTCFDKCVGTTVSLLNMIG